MSNKPLRVFHLILLMIFSSPLSAVISNDALKSCFSFGHSGFCPNIAFFFTITTNFRMRLMRTTCLFLAVAGYMNVTEAQTTTASTSSVSTTQASAPARGNEGL